MSTKYDNCDWKRCARTGGVTIATIGPSGTGQGNAGVSIPCRGCWIQSRDANAAVKMSIGTAATAVLGVTIAEPGVGAQPLWIPIADIAQLYFYGTIGSVIDITYLLG